MNYDHHNGKAVTKVNHKGDASKITFEDGSVVEVPGKISKDIVGQALLTVEGNTLIFGHPDPNGGEAVRRTSVIGHKPSEPEDLGDDIAADKAERASYEEPEEDDYRASMKAGLEAPAEPSEGEEE